MYEATEKQIAVIRRLAKQTNTAVDFGSIGSKKEASELIDELIGKRKSNNGNGNDCREKKVIYGLAVKLIFGRYQQQITNYRSDEFWKEVDEFYQKYLEHLDRAIKSGSQG